MLPNFPAEGNTDPVNQVTDLEELNEEMLMRAIAMSLEEEEEEEEVSEEELGSIKVQESGELLQKASKAPDTSFHMMQRKESTPACHLQMMMRRAIAISLEGGKCLSWIVPDLD